MPQTQDTNETSTATDESGAKSQGSGQGAKKKAAKKKSQGQKTQGQGKGQKKQREPRVKKEKPQRAVPAHLAKVDKVAAQLPMLSTDASVLVTAASQMATADIYAVINHLQIAVRRRGITMIAQGQARGDGKLAVGDRVTVISAQNPTHIGKTGTVDKVQRIRCYVKLDGKIYSQKDGRPSGDYFFHSDVRPLGGVNAGTGDLAETLQRLTRPAQGVDIMTLADENAAEEPTGT